MDFFSSLDHGWLVSDCTQEGFKEALLLSQMPSDLVGQKLETERLCHAVVSILFFPLHVSVFYKAYKHTEILKCRIQIGINYI